MQFFKKGQWIDLLQNLAVMLLYIVFAKIGLVLAIAEPTVTIFWPASGLALAVILIAGLNYLPGIFLGALIAALMVENTLQLSVLTALSSALEAFFGYWLLTWIRQVDISLTHTQDFFLLILYGAVLSTLASASIRVIAMATLYDHTINQLFDLSLRWWTADALGIAIMTPLILIWSSKKSWKFKPFLSAGIVQDITSHKVAEEALKVEERHLQAVLNNISDCVKLISRNGTLLSINTAGLALIEADSTDSMIGKCIYPSVVPEHRESFQAFNERVCDGVSGEMEFEMIGLKGTRRWMETHAVPFALGPSGEIVHLAYTQDITKRKQVEDQLILSKLLTERTLQEQRQFMAMLSHELKTPLSIIRMALGMEKLSQSQKRNAKQAVLDIDAITKRCLQADQVDQRQLKPTLQPCQINDMLESLIAEQHHRLNFQSAKLPIINSDYQLLHVILNNLVDNAIKYSDLQSIVKITTSLVNLNDKEYVLVSFVNSPGGAGMPDPKRVFEKYYRSPGAHSQSGSGLGLYIVHSMTELLGGCVRYSPAEKEVRFELCIPL